MKGKKLSKFGERKTYIINIDGMRADYFGAIGHQGCLTSTLVSLAQQGVQFSSCNDIMPANTGTNHTAIMTSAHAGSHGILGVGGYFKGLDKKHFRFSRKYGTPITGTYEHRHLQVPTFFNIIKANNPDLVAAFIPSKTWLGNIIPDKDCDITIYPGNTPENCGEHNPNPEYVTLPEGYVIGGPAHPEDNEIIPRFYLPKKGETEEEPPGTINFALINISAAMFPSDKWVIDQAINCVDKDNPDFMYLILMNMDLAGHIYGAPLANQIPDTTDDKNLSPLRNPAATRDQLYLMDQEIKRFIDYLEEKDLFDQTRIIITSDHGMTTMKSMLSGTSWKNMLYWLLEKLHPTKNVEKRKTVIRSPPIEELDIDVRRILAQHGIHMRASQGRWFHGYNPRGDYDWCFSDGFGVCYIYNANPTIQKKTEDILRNYEIRENGQKKYPIWVVLTEENMNDAINDHTDLPFRLGRGNFNEKYDAIWPSVIVFPRPHFLIPYYNDQLTLGLTSLMIKMALPGFIDLRIAPGAHGTYSEQNVPLIFVSKNEPEIPSGVVNNEQVSVLDIIPTINSLNGWPKQPTFEGKPLFPTARMHEKLERNKPLMKVWR